MSVDLSPHYFGTPKFIQAKSHIVELIGATSDLCSRDLIHVLDIFSKAFNGSKEGAKLIDLALQGWTELGEPLAPTVRLPDRSGHLRNVKSLALVVPADTWVLREIDLNELAKSDIFLVDSLVDHELLLELGVSPLLDIISEQFNLQDRGQDASEFTSRLNSTWFQANLRHLLVGTTLGTSEIEHCLGHLSGIAIALSDHCSPSWVVNSDQRCISPPAAAHSTQTCHFFALERLLLVPRSSPTSIRPSLIAHELDRVFHGAFASLGRLFPLLSLLSAENEEYALVLSLI